MGFLINSFIELPTATDFHTKSVDLDGSTEYLQNSTNNNLGFGDAWTISAWFKLDAAAAGGFLIDFGDGSTGNNRTFIILDGAVNTKFRISMNNSTGTQYKDLTQATAPSTGAIHHLVVTYDGGAGGDPVVVYLDNSVDSTTGTNNTGSVAYTSMRVRSVGGGLDGKLSRIDIWNTSLSASEVGGLNNSGTGYTLDVRNSNGNYTSTSALKHQWCLGKNVSSNIGEDFVASGNINIETNAVNVTDADIITFS